MRKQWHGSRLTETFKVSFRSGMHLHFSLLGSLKVSPMRNVNENNAAFHVPYFGNVIPFPMRKEASKNITTIFKPYRGSQVSGTVWDDF